MYYRPDRIPGHWTWANQQLYASDMAEHCMNSCQIASFFPAFGYEDYEELGRARLRTYSPKPWLHLLDDSEYADGRVDPARIIGAQMKIGLRAGLMHPDVPVFTVQEGITHCNRRKFVADRLRRLALERRWAEIALQTRDEPPSWYGGQGAIRQNVIQAMLEFKCMESFRTFTAKSEPAAFA